jgi:hypothetical protein
MASWPGRPSHPSMTNALDPFTRLISIPEAGRKDPTTRSMFRNSTENVKITSHYLDRFTEVCTKGEAIEWRDVRPSALEVLSRSRSDSIGDRGLLTTRPGNGMNSVLRRHTNAERNSFRFPEQQPSDIEYGSLEPIRDQFHRIPGRAKIGARHLDFSPAGAGGRRNVTTSVRTPSPGLNSDGRSPLKPPVQTTNVSRSNL